VDILLQFDHLSYDILDRGSPIESMRIPQVDNLHAKSFQALFAGNRNICSVAAKIETV
jgi:hypothetical protein